MGSEGIGGWANDAVVMRTTKLWSRFGDCKTHAITREENAHSVFWNLDVCHSYIHCWHRAKGVLGGYCRCNLPSFELGVAAGLDPSTADHV